MRRWLSVYLKGVSMGAADAVPGVSGGTIALITGIYERLVGAIAAFDPRVLADLPRAYDPDARGRIETTLREMDLGFLLVLGAGIMTAIVGVTGVVASIEESHPAVLFAFFFGLIAASAVALWGEVRVDTGGERAAAVVGLVLAFLLAGESASAAIPHSPFVLFVAGAIAICAMILPGVSGSFLLILFGQYIFMSNALHEFIDRAVEVVRGGPLEPAIGPAAAVASFIAGAAVGILTFARVVEWALANHRQVTLTFLVALMVGALRLPAARVVTADGAWPVARVAAVLLAALAGAAAVLLVDYYTDDLDYVEDERADPTPAPHND
jgi:putative membrane protein